MPAMPTREVLSPSQRAQFTDIPHAIGERELARYYTLSPEEMAVIAQRRRPSNRLGFAVQLCYLRFPGRPLHANEQVAEPILAYIAAQLDLDPAVMRDYARERDTTRLPIARWPRGSCRPRWGPIAASLSSWRSSRRCATARSLPPRCT